jgi:hypothetical protein
MQRGLGPSLEHEENDQHSKEYIGGGVDNLEVKQGVQDAKMTKPRRRNMKKQQEGALPWSPH